jgi:DNA-binding transcriptional ArsR family regulator
MSDVDRLVHEPARLRIVAILSSAREADFLFLQRETGLTKGNLSSHLAKLEDGEYVTIEKTFRGKISLTIVRLTPDGLRAFRAYKRSMEALLGLPRQARAT